MLKAFQILAPLLVMFSAFGQGSVYIPDSRIKLYDNTVNNSSTNAHGFLPKLANDGTKYLNGLGQWAAAASSATNVSESGLIFADITTADSSVSKHGLLPKLSGEAARALDGTGVWAAKDLVSVLHHGATTNSVADATAFFTAALARGKGIYVPDGTYFVNLAVDGRASIVGASRRGVILKPFDTSKPVLWINNNTSSLSDFAEFGNFTVEGSDASGSCGLRLGTNSAGVTGFARSTLRNITVQNCDTGIDVMAMTSATWQQVYVESGKVGISWNGEANIQNCTLLNVQSRINLNRNWELLSGNRCVFIACNGESGNHTGYFIRCGVSSGLRNSTFIGCWGENNGLSAGVGSYVTTNATLYVETSSSVLTNNSANLRFINPMFASFSNAFTIYISAANGLSLENGSLGTGDYVTNKIAYAATGNAGQVDVLFKNMGTLNEFPTPTMYANFPALATGALLASTAPDFGFKYEFEFQGIRQANCFYSGTHLFGKAGAPVDSPRFVGEFRRDTSNGKLYVADTPSTFLQLGSGGGGAQTPWASDINGAGFSLTNALNIDAATNSVGTLVLTNKMDGSNVLNNASVPSALLANSGVTAGVYGNGSFIPQITVNAQGQVTAVATNAASGGGGTAVGTYIKFGGTDTSFNPSSGGFTLYSGGSVFSVPSTSFTNQCVPLFKSGTIKAIGVRVRDDGTLGSSENVTFKVSINGAAGSGTGVVMPISAINNFGTSTGESIAITAGQAVALVFTTPTWATPPTFCYIEGWIYLE